MDFFPIIIAIAALIAGISFGYFMRKLITRKEVQSSENLSVRIVEEAKKEADNIKKEAILQAKESLIKTKGESEREARERKGELDKLEARLRSKEENQEKRIDMMVQKESNIENREKSLQQKENTLHEKHERLNRIIDDQKEKLEKIAGVTAEEAKAQLIQSMEAEAKREAVLLIRKAEEEAKRTADKKAQEIIAYSIQRYAGDFVAESTVSVVNLPTDEMKGRIIGREGRNIRAIEAATGVDLIIDDTPEAVVLSAFDPVRREVAKISLERLISDGRIHPGRIEDVVKKVQGEVEKIIQETGERASFDVGAHDIHPEIITLLGEAQVPLQLLPERAAALHRGGPPHGHHRRGTQARHQGGKACRAAS